MSEEEGCFKIPKSFSVNFAMFNSIQNCYLKVSLKFIDLGDFEVNSLIINDFTIIYQNSFVLSQAKNY